MRAHACDQSFSGMKSGERFCPRAKARACGAKVQRVQACACARACAKYARVRSVDDLMCQANPLTASKTKPKIIFVFVFVFVIFGPSCKKTKTKTKFIFVTSPEVLKMKLVLVETKLDFVFVFILLTIRTRNSKN